MRDLWFNKAGTLSRGQQRIIKRANSNNPVDPRDIPIYAPVSYQVEPSTNPNYPGMPTEQERINRGIQAGKDMASCIGQYKVAPCVDEHFRKSAEWMQGGRKGPMPIKNTCVENELKKSEKKKLTKAQTAEMLQGKVERERISGPRRPRGLDEEPTATFSGLSENIKYAPQGPLVKEQEDITTETIKLSKYGKNGEDSGSHHLQRETCDSLFNKVMNEGAHTGLGFASKLTAIECLSRCVETKQFFRETEQRIKDMESSPRYQNSIQEYGKEYTDIRIANKKAGLCASKRLLAWQCKDHRVETTEEKFIKYAPYIIGGVILYLILQK